MQSSDGTPAAPTTSPPIAAVATEPPATIADVGDVTESAAAPASGIRRRRNGPIDTDDGVGRGSGRGGAAGEHGPARVSASVHRRRRRLLDPDRRCGRRHVGEVAAGERGDDRHADLSGRRHLSPGGSHAPDAADGDDGGAAHPGSVHDAPADRRDHDHDHHDPSDDHRARPARGFAGGGRGDDQGDLAGRSRGQGARDRVARERLPIERQELVLLRPLPDPLGARTSRGWPTSASRRRSTCSTPAPTSRLRTRCTSAPADGDPGAAEPSSPSTAAGLDSSNAALVAQRIEHLTTDQKVGSSNLSGRTSSKWRSELV